MPHSTRKPAVGVAGCGAAVLHPSTVSRSRAPSVSRHGRHAMGAAGGVVCRHLTRLPSAHDGRTPGPRCPRDDPVLLGARPEALESVASSMRARRFRRGEVIFHIGDPGDALFVIVEGEVKISLPSETGEEAILATLRPGDVFGELALLDGAPRSASATAIERDRDRGPAARPVPRADRDGGRGPRRPARLDRRGAAAADDPCRGAPLPRHHRPARRPPRPPRAGGRDAACPTAASACGRI